MTGTITAAAAIPVLSAAAGPKTQAPAPSAPNDSATVSMRINGQPYRFGIDPRTSLLDLLRDHAGLTGTKKGCDHGQCGACTVLTDGIRTLSCMSFAVMNEGRDITTIEGLSSGDGNLHPMQQAFIDHDAFQCGYCTPGQILSGVGCVNEGHARNEADIREYMSGNLCRCAAYPNIVAAVVQGRDEMEKA
ncbi:(2Fe-2S)-binding protein [Rhizobium leguminosarum]|nr:(2Fe-2S)-binding protein [Rhizobium leguminosarum]